MTYSALNLVWRIFVWPRAILEVSAAAILEAHCGMGRYNDNLLDREHDLRHELRVST
jgi:hypothetical protein